MSRKLILFLWLWMVAGIAATIGLAVWQPSGPAKWVLWAIAIVPAVWLANVVVEGASNFFMSLPGIKQTTQYFENRAVGKKFSIARAAWYGFAALLGFVFVVALASVAWHLYSSASEFIAQDTCLDAGGRWDASQHKCNR